MMIGIDVPTNPTGGSIKVNVGPATTENVTALLVPPPVVTVTFLVPGAASAAIVRVAVNADSLVTFTPLTTTPDPLTLTVVAPPTNWLPVSVRPKVVPLGAESTLMAFNVGGP
jgi:hypothetical protein